MLLTVRLSPWVSDLVHEVSVRQQRLRGKEETEREYVKSDYADMHLSSDNTKIYSFTPQWDSNLRHLFIYWCS